MWWDDDSRWEQDEEERRRLQDAKDRQTERLVQELRDQEKQELAWQELRYYCGRDGHVLEAHPRGTSCRCGKESVEVFFA